MPGARIPRTMKLRRSLPLALLGLLLAAPALAQEPSPLLPGQEPEAAYGLPFWISAPVVLGAVGLVLILGLLYLRLSRRFFARDEPPPVTIRPRFAGMSAAQPVAAAPQGAPAAAPRATAAAASAGTAPSPPKEAAPKAEPSKEPAPQQGKDGASPGEGIKPDRPSEGSAPSSTPGDGPDQETFDRVLAEQLEKGVDRRVAEGRARAAAMKASREKAGGG